jgi:hypothetical protein
LSILLFCFAFAKAQTLTLPYVFSNNSRYADSEIYIGLVGKYSTMGDVWMSMKTSTLKTMSAADNTMNGPAWAIAAGTNTKYANMFTKLSDIPSKTIKIPHGLYGCRIFIAFKSPMYIYFHPTGGYAGANLGASTDANDGIRWELVELTWGDAGLWTNTSRVDAYQYPMGLEVVGYTGGVAGPYASSYATRIAQGGAYTTNKKIGEILTHDQILARWPNNVGTAFQGCKIIKTHSLDGEPIIEQPSKIDAFKSTGAYGNYFKSYIDAIWATYRTKDLLLDIGDRGVWRGRVTGDRFDFYDPVDNSQATIYSKPTTINAIEGSGAMAFSNASTQVKRDEDLMIQAQICAAINRHAIYTNVASNVIQYNHDDTRYFKVAPWNDYVSFWHNTAVSYESQTYAFCYDDVGDHSSTIQCTYPVNVKVVIGGYGGATVPVTGVSLSSTSTSLTVGATKTLTATVSPSKATIKTVVWKSSNTAVARVSSSGVVTAVSTGNATITATTTDGNKKATCAVTVTTPVTTHAIPGTIQAENYASMLGVATQTTGDVDGNLNVGWINVGDYMNYKVNVATAGEYTVKFRLSSINATGKLQLKKGTTVLGSVSVPNTSDWQKYTTVSTKVTLAAGTQTLQIYATAVSFNINWFSFEKVVSTSACNFTASTGDYSAKVTGASSNPSFTFVPITSGAGTKTCILYYSTSASGPFAGYNVTPNIPKTITAAKGATVYFYYTYSVASGGERTTLNNKQSIIVGNCGTTAKDALVVFEDETIETRQAVTAYPNPTFGQNLNISGINEQANILIFNMNGQLVKDIVINDSQDFAIETTDMPKGIYILKVVLLESNSTKLFKVSIN